MMKKISILLILVLFIEVSLFPIIKSIDLQQNAGTLTVNTRDIPLLKQMGPVGTYEEYINSREDKPYIFQRISKPYRSDLPLIILFIESDLVENLKDEISRYNKTLGRFGYDSAVYKVSGVTPEDLKDQIITYWENGSNVSGSVLIGDLPAEWFHHEYDFYGPAEFPCDLFLMDLDGTWTDTDGDGMYDSHTDGSGDTAPEIFVGRIDASRIPGDEITILKKYLAKVYDFWSGSTNQTKVGLTYTDQDWANYPEFRYDIGYAYENYEAIWYPDVDRDDYVNNKIPNTYEFIQLSCHSSYAGHAFTIGGWAYSDDIREAPPLALFYNLFCCSSLRFTEDNCLGYAYILDTDTSSLSVVGSAKTGSMLDFRYFYEPIGQGASFGTALRKWFEYEYPYDDSDISWFYGMTILGDPTLIIHCTKNLPPFGTNFTGPNEGTIDVDYTFCIDVFDQEGDLIYCNWSWGDGKSTGWIGPYTSGETACTTHNWTNSGNYEIRINLKDDMGSESGWSEPYPIYILKSSIMKIGKVNGGLFKINAELKNIGEEEAINVKWNITLDGGFILIGRKSNGILQSASPGEMITVDSKPIIGLGKVIVTVRVEIPENIETRDINGKVFLFYLKVNPSG